MRKLLSILLILTMLISTVPVYATGNNDTLPSNPSAGKGSAFWNIPAYNDLGMRVTVYWGLDEDAFISGKVRRIGDPTDFAKQGSGARYQIEQYTTRSVFDYMRTKSLDKDLFKSETSVKNYKYVLDNTMPDIRRTVSDFKTAKTEWDKWILSPDSSGTYTFTNLSNITSKLGQKIEPNDLRDGIYRLEGNKLKGIYKIYIEPVSYSFIDGIYSAMTMRDLISWQYSYDKGYIKTDKIKSNSTGDYYNPSIITALTPLFDTTGNSQYLLYDVNALNLKGNNPLYQIDGSTTSDARTEIKKQIQPGGKIYNSMGVGEYELPVKTTNDYPTVYRTYSMVEDVVNGKIKYKHIASRHMVAELSLGGGYTPPESSYVFFPDGNTHIRGTAVLNDMVVSRAVMDPSTLIWDNLPKSDAGEITAKDIDYYALSLAEGAGVDIDLYTNYFKKNDTERYNNLTTLHKDLTLAIQADAAKSTYETKQNINNLYFNIYMLIGGSYARSGLITTSNTIDDLIKSRFGDILSKPKQLTKITEIPLKQGDNYYSAYEHYIILPSSSQVNIIETRQEGTNKLIKSKIEIEPIQISGAQIEVQIAPKVGLEFEEYKVSTSKDLSKMPTSGIKQQGTKIEDTVTISLVDNLFVRWVEYVPYTTSAGTDTVPEWRLSKYVSAGNSKWLKSTMSLGNLIQDDPIAVSLGYRGYLTPTNLSYAPINANGKQGVDTRYNDWLYSKTVTQGSYNLSRNNPSADIDVRADKHLIKSTNGFGLSLANWIGNNTISGVSDISASNKGNIFKGSEVVEKSASLNLKTLNTNDFNNYYSTTYEVSVTRTGIKYSRDSKGNLISTPYTYTDTETRGRVSGPQTITPNQALYTPAVDNVLVTFERYKPSIIDNKIKITPKADVDNGLTTITLDTKKLLNVYPEVAMLYQDATGTNHIRFVAGDIARTVPVASYHTMDYSVFVKPTVTTPTATIDSRARQIATKIGLTGLQPLILKGGMVTSGFDLKKSKTSNEKGELVVKSYTLDLADNVKSAWGSTVNINQIHTDYLTKWDFNNASGFSKLEIANANNNGAVYTGPEVYSNKKLGNIKYTKSTDSSKTYSLTVRGGALTAVDGVALNTIKSNNQELYKALEGLQLIGSNSVLSNFAHKEGKKLTEAEFKTKAAAAKGIDNLTVNEGWYSEDSTVLVIREIITTYKIDNYFSTDAIPLTVKGLETPINKGEFYSKAFRGHTVLNYSLPSKDFGAGIGTINAYFEHNSRTGSDFGDKTVEYGVPNVSIQDGTGW